MMGTCESMMRNSVVYKCKSVGYIREMSALYCMVLTMLRAQNHNG